MPSENKSQSIVSIIAIVAIVILAGGFVWTKFFHQSSQPNPNQPVACTADAKMCPDGSYVGRTGPMCEFAACPVSVNGLKTFTDLKNGVTFQYPEQIGTTYIHTVDWPPKLSVTAGPFTCTGAGAETAQAGLTQKQVINGRTYCVTKESEGAAGSTYTQYVYAFVKADKVDILTFSLRTVQCDNYDDPQKTECKKERNTFSVDNLTDQIAQSLKKI